MLTLKYLLPMCHGSHCVPQKDMLKSQDGKWSYVEIGALQT